jgi:hypothetical protein
MTKSIRDSKNPRPKIGRPKTTGTGQPQVVRMHDHQIAAIDAWIATEDAEISRPEAIRRLVELGLRASKPTKGTRSPPNKRRAAELAAKAIGMLVDVSTPVEEINRRRQRLTNGPTEFREHRLDLPKPKK